MMLLARGLNTKDVAAELTLSPHTVRDHIKAARLFAHDVLEGFHAAVHRLS